MIKHLRIQSPEEDIEEQIDRLNFAVQRLMQGIELSSQTPRNPSQLSFTHPSWLDEEDEQEKSIEMAIPADLESKFEEILVSLDRTQMINEDFWSEQFRRENAKSSVENDAYVIKLEKENMELRSRQPISRSDYTLNLRKNPSLEAEKRNFEEKLAQLDKLNEVYHAKNQNIQKVQESLKVKEKWIDQKEKELRASWQNFEKMKQDWETNKNNPTGYMSKSPIKSTFKSEKPQPGSTKSDFSLNRPELLTTHQGAPPPNAPETPSSRQRSLANLQNELKDLEASLSSITDPVEYSKLVMKIDQIKNKIATIRGQIALYQSNRSSRLISHMMKTMEKEVNYEENKRKQQLEKFTKKTGGKASDDLLKPQQNVNNETARRVLPNDSIPIANVSISIPIPKPLSSTKLTEEKQLLDFRKEMLNKRERELTQREALCQETWMKIPGSKDLIEVVNKALSKLTEQKNELDSEREAFEKEKVEMLKLRDKLMEQMNKIKN